MALGTNKYTLLEFAKRTDEKGKQQAIAELLMQKNSILDDIVFKEANLSTGERVAIRTGLPQAYWRAHNEGVPPSSSTTAQNTFPIKELQIWGQNDSGLMELGGDLNQARLNELIALTEGINQAFATNYFYGDVNVDEKRFSGLAATYNSLSGDISRNVIDGGGAGGDNASIYLVNHGQNTVYCAFPKGSRAGIQHDDLGLQTSEVGGLQKVYRECLQFSATLAIKDWRHAVRICNIDVSDLAGGSPADLFELMIKAVHNIEQTDNAVFYMNRTLLTYLDIQARSDVQNGGQLSYDNVDGRVITRFRGIPVKRVDALLLNETAVS